MSGSRTRGGRRWTISRHFRESTPRGGRLVDRAYYSALNKISVSCKTCEVSESFYSSMSVKRFRLEHVGHEVVEGGIYTPTNGRQETEHAEKVRLLKVLVELVMLPSYPTPVFTITGVKDNLKNAFVQVVSPSQRDQVRETLERGKYLDAGASDTVYVWEPKSISFSEDANLAMSFGPSRAFGPEATDPSPSTDEPSPSDASSASGNGQETQIALSGGEQTAVVVSQPAPQEAPVLDAPSPPSDSAAPPPPSQPSAQAETASPTPARQDADVGAAIPVAETAALAMPSPERVEAPTPTTPEGKEAEAMSNTEDQQDAKVEEDKYLLVSRSWYIEGGSKNMGEAVRISRILRPFRWTVEPAYTIGVMVDDILSVETANGEIGGDMTKEIEGAGYKLTRVSVVKGKPVAWFKKEPAPGRDALGR